MIYPNIPGLIRQNELLFLYENFLVHFKDQPITIIEIGSFLGRSAKFFSLNSHPDTKIYCISPNLDERLHPINEEQYMSMMKRVDLDKIKVNVPVPTPGTPGNLELFLQYTENDPKIIPICGFSPHENINGKEAEIVFNDGNHESPFINKDLNYWWTRIKPGGFLAGHDFCARYINIMRAVSKIANNEQLDIISKNKFYLGSDGKEPVEFIQQCQLYMSCWGIKKPL